MLEFLNHHAQASEISTPSKRQSKPDPSTRKPLTHPKPVSSFVANCDPSHTQCPLCKTEKHPLYSCPKFRLLSHERKMVTVKVNNIWMNCPNKVHFVAKCKCHHRSRKCQNPHHTLLHIDHREQRKDRPHQSVTSTLNELEVSANTAAAKLKPAHC